MGQVMTELRQKCPAPAGMIPSPKPKNLRNPQMPRTCGDDPEWLTVEMDAFGNAPHLRG